ncbi:MAG: 30S ribosomal protein S17 [Myxococcota bacterium]
MIKQSEASTQELENGKKGRVLKGVVTSSCRQKTITVQVQQFKRHCKYGRFIRTRTRYHAHDEGNVCAVGDEVVIIESKPYSRLKRWRLRQVVAKNQQEQ